MHHSKRLVVVFCITPTLHPPKTGQQTLSGQFNCCKIFTALSKFVNFFIIFKKLN